MMGEGNHQIIGLPGEVFRPSCWGYSDCAGVFAGALDECVGIICASDMGGDLIFYKPEGAINELSIMLKLSVIGVGNWGINHIRIFHQLPDVQIASVCDLHEENLTKVRQIGSNIPISRNADEVISDTNIDAVVVATPAEEHYGLAKHVLMAGKHCLVEKPITLKVEHAEELIEIAESKNLVLMVGHLLLYHPAVLKLKEYISNGELGTIYYMYSNRVNLGQVRKTENALWSLAPHDISVMLFLLEKEPIAVSAHGKCFLQDGIEDVVFFSLDFQGNVLGHGQVSWLDPHKIRKFTVVGSKKMVVFDDMDATEKIKIFDKGVHGERRIESYGDVLTIRNGDIHIPYIQMSEPLKIECQHFVDCILSNKKPRTDGYDGLRVLRVLEAAQKSLNSGGIPVKISPTGGIDSVRGINSAARFKLTRA